MPDPVITQAAETVLPQAAATGLIIAGASAAALGALAALIKRGYDVPEQDVSPWDSATGVPRDM